jgi:hypothetical protein
VTFVNKNTILNVIMMICIFNFVFLGGSTVLVEQFTGDVVLSGNINHGKILEGNPMLTENKDVTFVFESRYDSDLHITIVNPDGIEFSWIKKFRTSEPSKPTVDYTFVFTPKSTGTYCIKISNAKSYTDIKVVSGMINPTKNGLILVGSSVFWIIGMLFIAIHYNHQIHHSSIKQAIIALMISLITTYIVVLYSSV